MIRLALLIGVLLPMLTFGQPAPGFVIDGNVKGLKGGTVVCLTDVSNPTDTVAQAQAGDERFILKGHVSEPNLYTLRFGDDKSRTTLFLGNDKMSLSGTIDDLRGLKMTGSSSNDDFQTFQQTFNPYFTRLNSLVKDTGAYKRLVDTIETQIDLFIADRRSSYVSAFVLAALDELSYDPLRREIRLSSLSAAVKKGYYGQYLARKIEEMSVGAVGSQAIDFTQTDTAGGAVTLSSFKGKYVLLDFWASWCGPCRMENPHVVSAYTKFRNKNFTVLGVSLDKDKGAWLQAIRDDGLLWTQVSDLKFWYNEVAVKYHIESIPQNFLIDPNGKIIGKDLRGGDLDAKLCEIFGCN